MIVLNDLTADQVKAFRLADNKVGEIAEWDFEALAIELRDIQMDMSQFDFEMPEAQIQVEEDDFEVNLPKTPKSKYGDIYRLGKHRLMCGDATNAEDAERLMDMDIADLLVVDPPYNVDYEGTAGKIMNDKQSDNQFQEFLFAMFSVANANLKRGGGSTYGTLIARASTSEQRAKE